MKPLSALLLPCKRWLDSALLAGKKAMPGLGLKIKALDKEHSAKEPDGLLLKDTVRHLLYVFRTEKEPTRRMALLTLALLQEVSIEGEKNQGWGPIESKMNRVSLDLAHHAPSLGRYAHQKLMSVDGVNFELSLTMEMDSTKPLTSIDNLEADWAWKVSIRVYAGDCTIVSGLSWEADTPWNAYLVAQTVAALIKRGIEH